LEKTNQSLHQSSEGYSHLKQEIADTKSKLLAATTKTKVLQDRSDITEQELSIKSVIF
jgi:hypothetical protein